jgi:hypothetical protein
VVYRPAGFTPFELQCAQVYGHTRLYTVPESLKKLATGRLVATGLSFYAWKINRDWQKDNQEYLRKLAAESASADLAGAQAASPALASPAGWTDATRRPAAATCKAA